MSQFVACLKDHRIQANEQSRFSHKEEQALAHDRALFPRQGHNERGEEVFDMSDAKLFLRADVANKLHTVMKPSELQRTCAEYMVFKPTIFKCRVYQEARLQKYFNFRD
jgi:hypothetical protein